MKEEFSFMISFLSSFFDFEVVVDEQTGTVDKVLLSFLKRENKLSANLRTEIVEF
jgi:hypothetical protein